MEEKLFQRFIDITNEKIANRKITHQFAYGYMSAVLDVYEIIGECKDYVRFSEIVMELYGGENNE